MWAHLLVLHLCTLQTPAECVLELHHITVSAQVPAECVLELHHITVREFKDLAHTSAPPPHQPTIHNLDLFCQWQVSMSTPCNPTTSTLSHTLILLSEWGL